MALIKFNLLDFFQLPLEWAGGVNRATLEEREKELAEEKFPLEIVQTSVHWSTSKREKRKSSRGEKGWGVAKYLRNFVCNIFYSAPILPSRNIYSIFGLPDLAFAFKIKFFVFVSLSRLPVDQLGGQRKDETPEKCIFHKN